MLFLLMANKNLLTYDGVPFNSGTSPLICRANQWTGFYMIRISVMKEIKCLMDVYEQFKEILEHPLPNHRTVFMSLIKLS